MNSPSSAPLVCQKPSYISHIASKCRILLLCTLGLVQGDNYGSYSSSIAERDDSVEAYEVCKQRTYKDLNVSQLPSVCDTYQETALVGNPYMDDLCKPEREAKKNNQTLVETDEYNEDAQYAALYDYCGIMELKEYLNSGAPFPDEVPEKHGMENAISLDSLPGDYGQLLQEFDPEFFDRIKGFVYVKILPEGSDIDGRKIGPGLIENNQFVVSKDGKHHLITIAHDLKKIDFKQVIALKDWKKINAFIRDISILAHEINGHCAYNPLEDSEETSFERICQGDVVGIVKSELYAYWISAKMIFFLANRYPSLKTLIEQESLKHEQIRVKHDANTTLRTSVSEEISRMHENNELLLDPIIVKFYKAFSRGKQTNDWSDFKSYVLAKSINHQFGLAYLLYLFKESDELSDFCYYGLNQRIEEMLGSESPKLDSEF